jgi:hypothetical protein
VPARGAAQRCRLDLNTAQFGNAALGGARWLRSGRTRWLLGRCVLVVSGGRQLQQVHAVMGAHCCGGGLV